MVLKKSKHDLNTGNSLHLGREAKRARHGFVAKTIHNRRDDVDSLEQWSHDSLCGYLDDGYMGTQRDVVYSLDKRKRWTLCEEIKEVVEDKDLEEEDFKVTMVERSNPGGSPYQRVAPGNATSFGYHDSKTPLKHAMSKRKYAFYHDLKVKAEQKWTPKRRRNSLRDDEQPEEEVPEIMYDIIHPQELTGRIQDSHDTYARNWGLRYCDKSSKKSKHCRNKAKVMYQGYSDTDLKSMICSSEESPAYTGPAHTAQPANESIDQDGWEVYDPTMWDNAYDKNNYCLSEFVRASTPKKMKKPKTLKRTAEETHTKTHIIYEEQTSSDESTDDAMDDVTEHETPSIVSLATKLSNYDKGLVPIKCVVDSVDLSPASLTSSYGENYEEASCWPRRFTLHVAEKTKVMFEVGDLGEICEDGEEFGTNVRFHICHINSDQALYDQIKEFCCHGNTRLDHLLSIIIQCLKERNMFESPAAAHYEGKNLKSEWQTALEGSSVHVYHIDQVEQHLDTDKPSTQDLKTVSRCLSQPGAQSACDICFDEIVVGDDSVTSGGTFLKKCGHGFCNGCWKLHLVGRLGQGDGEIMCPAFKCETTVDHVTLQSLLPWELYQQFATRLIERKVDAEPDWTWCQNHLCRSVINIRVDNVTLRNLGCSARCHCGHQWCVDCGGDPHYPASCKQAKAYIKKLKDSGFYHKGMERFNSCSVKVKKCKKCHLQMEKNGGCSHMSCRCGHSFCWTCLAPISQHKNGCPSPTVSVWEVTLKDDVQILFAMCYRYALACRKEAIKLKPKVVFQKAQLLARKIQKAEQTKTIPSRPACHSPEHARFMSNVTSFQVCLETVAQMYRFMENINVLLSHCTRRTVSKRLMDSVDNLHYVVQSINDVFEPTLTLKGAKGAKVNLEKLMEGANKQVKDMIPMVQATRRKIQEREEMEQDEN